MHAFYFIGANPAPTRDDAGGGPATAAAAGAAAAIGRHRAPRGPPRHGAAARRRQCEAADGGQTASRHRQVRPDSPSLPIWLYQSPSAHRNHASTRPSEGPTTPTGSTADLTSGVIMLDRQSEFYQRISACQLRRSLCAV